MSKWHGGKGSRERPIKDREKFNNNWDNIFKKKDKKKNESTKHKRVLQTI